MPADLIAPAMGPQLSDLECAICQLDIGHGDDIFQHVSKYEDDTTESACLNTWHTECISSWATASKYPKCPLCRRTCDMKLQQNYPPVIYRRRFVDTACGDDCSSINWCINVSIYERPYMSVYNALKATGEQKYGKSVSLRDLIMDQECLYLDDDNSWWKMYLWYQFVGCTSARAITMNLMGDDEYPRACELYFPEVPALEFLPSHDALRSRIGNIKFRQLSFGATHNQQVPLSLQLITHVLETLRWTNAAGYRTAYDQLTQALYWSSKRYHENGDLRWRLLENAPRFFALFNISVPDTATGRRAPRLFAISWPQQEIDSRGPKIEDEYSPRA